MKARSLATTAAAALAATALLTGVAFATSNAIDTADTDGPDHDSAIAKLAKTTTATGQAKGAAISAAAKAGADAKDTDAEDKDTDQDNEDTDQDNEDTHKTDADAHGDTVSALAKSTPAGTEHSATISATARKGHGSR